MHQQPAFSNKAIIMKPPSTTAKKIKQKRPGITVIKCTNTMSLGMYYSNIMVFWHIPWHYQSTCPKNMVIPCHFSPNKTTTQTLSSWICINCTLDWNKKLQTVGDLLSLQSKGNRKKDWCKTEGLKYSAVLSPATTWFTLLRNRLFKQKLLGC